ncbi:membrane protein insertase YidC [Campylobacter sp. JMF_06 NA1]|nr:membrane protein insertase YidC [Campylobacter sp. JMF_06 NA1]MDA3078452.1 membrane protein insertase YidC [Campylobacter sp. JMF_06 NA1]
MIVLDQISQQKRLGLAILLAFLFFVAYDHFYMSKVRAAMEANKTATAAQSAQSVAKQAPTSASASITPSASAGASAQNQLVKIVGKEANFTIDNFGRISSYTLNDKKFTKDGEPINLISKDGDSKPLEIRFEDANLNELAFSTPYTASADRLDITNGAASVVLTQNLGDFVVSKNLKFNPNGSYEIDIKFNRPTSYFITPGSRPDVEVDGYTIHGITVGKSDDTVEIFEDGDVSENERVENAIFVASSDRYYTSLFFGENLNTTITSANDISQAFIRANGDFKSIGYIGPKDYVTLKEVDPKLTNVIEYGWFTFIARPMFKFLRWIYSHVGNWGWAIVILTLIIRAALFPLSYKGMLSMNKLKDLAPKMKELQEKYKGDPQKLQMHMMELYRKNGANPMGGCLPILLQIPVFFAIYRVLLNAIELKGAEWAMWIHDLSLKDPYYILPILMTALMFLQQKITPTSFTDPMQEKVMKFLPLMFGVFFLMFPAGLTLYWTVNNMCSIVQQYVINKIFARQKQAQISEKKHEN